MQSNLDFFNHFLCAVVSAVFMLVCAAAIATANPTAQIETIVRVLIGFPLAGLAVISRLDEPASGSGVLLLPNCRIVSGSATLCSVKLLTGRHTMTDIKSPEDKIAAAILTLASALRDQNVVSDGSLENIFGFYRRYLEAVRTGRVPAK